MFILLQTDPARDNAVQEELGDMPVRSQRCTPGLPNKGCPVSLPR